MFKSLELFNDRFFEDFFEGSKKAKLISDVYETNDKIVLEVELPGYKKEMVKASVEDEYLIISASVSDEDFIKQNSNKKFVLKERKIDNISRMYYIGKGYNLQNIEAKYENGILTVLLPKEVKNKKRTIEIF